ncbi:MAG: HlyD family secretion protein [Candidatus Methanoplasma sp.]|jgi:biotin carboxyl carrier protein|nr:HlyD family secretion protein [Candidatus Methanoplasma sp.]
MTKQLRNLDDLRDSSMLYSKNPPKFMTAIVAVILVSLIAAVAVADMSKKSEVIHSTGIIQSDDKIYMMSSVSGEIDEVHVVEGQYVEGGDNLITIGSAQPKAQLEMYTGLADYYWSILGGYVQMLDMIKNYDINKDIRTNSRNQNPFNSHSDRFMYLIFEGFLDQMSQIEADEYNTLSENRQSSLDSTLMECERVIREYEPTYMQALFQKEYAETLVEESTIKAKTSGIVHLEAVLKTGMVVSSGTLLFSVSGAIDANEAMVKLQIPVAYRPYLFEDSIVHMDVVGYPSATYGKLEGRVTGIGSDSSIDSNGNVWFTAEVMIDETVLNKKAVSIQVMNGMMVNASIIYEESTWLDWLLRGLGFR